MPLSSQPQSSQAHISSQGAESSLSDRSISDVSIKEKTQWREYSEPREFFKFTGWDNAHLNSFLYSFDNESQVSFLESLVTKARRDMSLLYSEIGPDGYLKNDRDAQIDWEKIPHTRGITPTEESSDNLIYVWIRLKKFDSFLNEKS